MKKKSRQIVAAVVCGVLIIGMILPLLLSVIM